MLFIHVTRLEPDPDEPERVTSPDLDGYEYELSPETLERLRFTRYRLQSEIAEHNAGRGLIGKPPLD